jgi:hypothetical protein
MITKKSKKFYFKKILFLVPFILSIKIQAKKILDLNLYPEMLDPANTIYNQTIVSEIVQKM